MDATQLNGNIEPTFPAYSRGVVVTRRETVWLTTQQEWMGENNNVLRRQENELQFLYNKKKNENNIYVYVYIPEIQINEILV